LNKLINVHEIYQGAHATEENLEAIVFKSRSFNYSEIADVETSDVFAKLEPLKIGP
jgi:ferredoxin-fold anticodon binding domain-containing protein